MVPAGTKTEVQTVTVPEVAAFRRKALGLHDKERTAVVHVQLRLEIAIGGVKIFEGSTRNPPE